MALPFETMSPEERSQERAARARRRETWGKETREQKMMYDMAIGYTTEREALEDALVKVAEEADGPAKVRHYTVLRQSIARLAERYKKVEVAAKYGWATAEDIFEHGEAIEGMTEAQAKLLKNHIKKAEESSGGGKAKKKTGSESSGGDGDYAGRSNWGWQWAPPPGFPQLPQSSTRQRR